MKGKFTEKTETYSRSQLEIILKQNWLQNNVDYFTCANNIGAQHAIKLDKY